MTVAPHQCTSTPAPSLTPAPWTEHLRATSERLQGGCPWDKPQQIKDRYPSADIVADRVVFNIKGNTYRLIVAVYFPNRTMFIKFIGTHAEYDKIDAATVRSVVY